MWDIPLLGRKIREMRQHGLLIALDDVGSGAASLKKIVEYEPDIVKLDRFFGKQLAASPSKQKLVALFVAYCSEHRSSCSKESSSLKIWPLPVCWASLTDKALGWGVPGAAHRLRRGCRGEPDGFHEASKRRPRMLEDMAPNNQELMTT